MPSVSKKQHNFMEAIAHSPEFAKKAGVPQSVGKDFASADKGKKFSFGGKAMINKRDTRHGKTDMPNANLSKYIGMKRGGEMKESKAMVKKEVSFFKKKGAPASMVKHEEAEMKGMKKGGMADGGMAMRKGMPSRGMRPQMGAGMPPRGMPPRMMRPPAPASDMAAPGMKKGGMAKRSEKDVAKDQQSMSNMATYARGGGIESRGKTKGTMVKMAEGGVVKFARGGGIESRGKTRGKMC